MPTYEYLCSKCAYTFEVTQKMSDEPLKKCPKCFKPVKRLIGSGSGIIFKGSGFYATDYRKKSGSSDPAAPSTCPSGQKGCSGCPGVQK